MSDIYDMFLEACAHADEREEVCGHIAAISTIITLINIILGVIAVLGGFFILMKVVFIIALITTAFNLLRILVRELEWHGVVAGIVKIIITLVVFTAFLLCFRYIDKINFFVVKKFAEEVSVNVLWYYSVAIASVAHLIVARFL